MKKKAYITPSVVTVKLHNGSLLNTVSGFESTTDNNTSVNPGNSLGKSGWDWSNDDDVDYEE